MAREMTGEEYRDFLLGSVRTATLATVRADGRPHAAPIWYHLDGETFVFTTGANTMKGRNMERDGRVSLCIDDERPPSTSSSWRASPRSPTATPTCSSGRPAWEDATWARIRPRSSAAANAVPGELLVRVTPTKVLAHKNIAD